MSSEFKILPLAKVIENKSRRFDFKKYKDVVFINTGDVQNGVFLHSELSSIVGLPGQAKKAIKQNDILFSEIRPANGRYALVNKNSENYVVSTKFMVLNKINDEVDLDYLYLYLTSRNVLNEFQRIAESRSGTFPQITFDAISYFPIPTPPLQEQKRIAHILGTLDDKIELNRKMNQTLESMAQALFQSWFVDFDPVLDNAINLGNPIPDQLHTKAEKRKNVPSSKKLINSNPEIAKLFPSSFEFNEKLNKWIPKGWEDKSFGEEYRITMGQSPPGSSYNEEQIGTAFFQGKTDFGFRFPKNRIYCTVPKREAKKNDTLISVRAPVGSAYLAASDCVIGRGLCAVRHNSNSISYTYYSILELKKIFDVFEGEGTVFGSINQNDLNSIPIIKPNKKIESEFDIIAGKWDSKIEINSSLITSLISQRDVLLPKLLNEKKNGRKHNKTS